MMNRRTLLKGAAATAATGTLGVRRPRKSFAAPAASQRRLTPGKVQLPHQYEIISFFESNEWVESEGTRFIGTARDITNEGTIVGDVVVDGLTRPVMWDDSLTMTFLDLGTYEGLHARTFLANDRGRIFGKIQQFDPALTAAENSSMATMDLNSWTNLFWTDWAMDEALTRSIPAGASIATVTASNMMLGNVDLEPVVWVDDRLSGPELPAERPYGGFRAINAQGDLAGSSYQGIEPWFDGRPMVWKKDGRLQVFDQPAGVAADWPGAVVIYQLGEDGTLVAHARDDASSVWGHAYRTDGVEQVPIADVYGEGSSLIRANASGMMIGASLLNGSLSIPTVWIDDQPMAIADLIVPGPDLLLLAVNGINDAGAMVGDAQDSSGIRHHVLLRPVQ